MPLILSAVAYVFIGVVTGALAGRASSHPWVVAWRLAAWLASAVVFSAQILHERSLGRSPAVTAMRASLAAALGALGLAAVAILHRVSSGTGNPWRMGIALAVWPIVTAVPAFLVALAAAAMLGPRKPTA